MRLVKKMRFAEPIYVLDKLSLPLTTMGYLKYSVVNRLL